MPLKDSPPSSMASKSDPEREIVRHMLAALAYRAAKAVREAPPGFAGLRIGATSRSPVEIVAHMGDLMEWALTMAQDRTQWPNHTPLPWHDEVDRLFAGITALDRYLGSGTAIDREILLKLIQGPIADALTHTGQLTMLRRLANSPIRGESYPSALIAVGQTGLDQPPPQREFD